MKRKLHNKMHENISFHHERTTKSDKINYLSRGDGDYDNDGIMALAETTNENHR